MWLHGVSAIICHVRVNIVRYMVSYYVCYINYMYDLGVSLF